MSSGSDAAAGRQAGRQAIDHGWCKHVSLGWRCSWTPLRHTPEGDIAGAAGQVEHAHPWDRVQRGDQVVFPQPVRAGTSDHETDGQQWRAGQQRGQARHTRLPAALASCQLTGEFRRT